MRSCMMLKASTITVEMPGRPPPPKKFALHGALGRKKLAEAAFGRGRLDRDVKRGDHA